jgi:hypothetical protein
LKKRIFAFLAKIIRLYLVAVLAAQHEQLYVQVEIMQQLHIPVTVISQYLKESHT